MSEIGIDNGGIVKISEEAVGPDVRAGDGISVSAGVGFKTVEVNHGYSNEWTVQQKVKTSVDDESAVSGWNQATSGIGVSGAAETGAGVYGMTDDGYGVLAGAYGDGIPIHAEVVSSGVGESIMARLTKTCSPTVAATAQTAATIETYLPPTSAVPGNLLASYWRVAYDSLLSTTAKAVLGLRNGGLVDAAYTFSLGTFLQPSGSEHLFGSIGFRSYGNKMQFKDSNTGGSWADVYQPSGPGEGGVSDTVAPLTPTNLCFAWRNEGDISLSWLNASPTADGNRLIHDYEIEAAYDSDFKDLFYHQHIGRQTETILGVKSLAPSFDLRMPDGELDHVIELVSSGTATGGTTSTLTSSDTFTGTVTAGMVVRYRDSSGLWSYGEVSSVAAHQLSVTGRWSNCYGNSGMIPKSGCEYEVMRTLFEPIFRDYSDSSSAYYGQIGFNEATVDGFTSSSQLLGGCIVSEGDLDSDGYTGVTCLRYPMHDPNYMVECELEMKNPFNSGHIATAVRCSARDLSITPYVHAPSYYACILDFGSGGPLTHNAAWVEKKVYPNAASEGGVINCVYPSKATLTDGILSAATTVPVAEASIFQASISHSVTASGFTDTSLNVLVGDTVTGVMRGSVVTYGNWKAVVSSVDDPTAFHRTINVFGWFCSVAGGGSRPSASGSATITHDRYAMIVNSSVEPYYTECVKVDAVDTGANTITVTRAQKGSTASTFTTGSTIAPRFTPEYNRKYRVLVDVSNAVAGAAPVVINFYIDGVLYYSFSDSADGTTISTSDTTFGTVSPYLTIGVPNGNTLTHITTGVQPGDVVYEQSSGVYASVAHVLRSPGGDTIYINAWSGTTPSNGATIVGNRQAIHIPGQIAIGGLNWGIHNGNAGQLDLYVYRLNSKYTSYRMSDVYCRVRAHNQIGKSPWSEAVTIHAPDRLSPNLSALDIVPDHHVVAWDFDALAPEVSGYELQAYKSETGGSSDWVYTIPTGLSDRLRLVPMDNDATHDVLWWQICSIDPFGKGEFSPFRVATRPSRSTSGGDSEWYTKSVDGLERTYLGDASAASANPAVVGSDEPLSRSGTYAKFSSLGDAEQPTGLYGKSVGDISSAGVIGEATGSGFGVLGISDGSWWGVGAVTTAPAASGIVAAGGVKREASSGTAVAGTGVSWDWWLESGTYPSMTPHLSGRLAAEWDTDTTTSKLSVHSLYGADLLRLAEFVGHYSGGASSYSSELRMIGEGGSAGGYVVAMNSAFATVPLYLKASSVYIGNNATGSASGSNLVMQGPSSRNVTISPSALIEGSYSLTLPVNAGSPNYVLATDGNGLLSWVANAAGTSPWTTDTVPNPDQVTLVTAGNNVRIGTSYAATGSLWSTNRLFVDGTVACITNGISKPGITFGDSTGSGTPTPWVALTEARSSNYGYLAVYTKADSSTALQERATIGPYDSLDNTAINLFSGATSGKQYGIVRSLNTDGSTKRDLLLVGSGVRVNNTLTFGWNAGLSTTGALLVCQGTSGTGGHTQYGSAIVGDSIDEYTIGVLGKSSTRYGYGVVAVNTNNNYDLHAGYAGGFMHSRITCGGAVATPLALRNHCSVDAQQPTMGYGVGMDYLATNPAGEATGGVPNLALNLAYTWGAYKSVSSTYKGAFGVAVLEGTSPRLATIVDSDTNQGAARLRLYTYTTGHAAVIRAQGLQGPHTADLGDGNASKLKLEATEIDFNYGSGSPQFKINSTKVLTVQQAAISDGLSDTAKIAAILSALRAHGLIAT